jgi:hypothetical protein
MKTGGGDFSAEAYQQLREAYDKEQQRQVDDEIAGTKLMGQEYGLETMPVDSPWADKVDKWEYPDGKSQYLDKHQSPEEILEIMRQSAQERVDAKKEEEDPDGLEEMSDEEFDAHIDKILADVEEEVEAEAEAEAEEEDTEEDDDEDEEGEEDDAEVEEESDEDDEEEDDEPESEEDEEEEPESEEPEEESYDAEDVANQIAELRAEIEQMQFVTEPEDEEPSDDESE